MKSSMSEMTNGGITIRNVRFHMAFKNQIIII